MWSPGHRLRRSLVLVALVALSGLVAACADDTDRPGGAIGDDGPTTSVVGTDTAAVDAAAVSVDDTAGARAMLIAELRDRGLTSVATAIQGVDVDDLVGTGEYTFFAPSDEAFTAIDADELAALMSDDERLIETVRNHVVGERITGRDLYERDVAVSRGGEILSIVSIGATVTVGGATVTETDIGVGDDGVVHAVDELIVPG